MAKAKKKNPKKGGVVRQGRCEWEEVHDRWNKDSLSHYVGLGAYQLWKAWGHVLYHVIHVILYLHVFLIIMTNA